jgi:SulP family sulfate permease
VHAAEKLTQFELNPIALAVGAGSLALLLLLQRARPSWNGGLIVLTIVCLASHVFKLQGEMPTVATLGGLARTMPVFDGAPLAMLSSLPVLVNAALALAIIGMLEAVSISKNIAATSGQRLDPNQELLGLGTGNLAASFFGAMPGSGSFVRSAINVTSGGRTQISGIASAIGLGAIIWLVAPLAAAIPLSSVAAILLVVAAQMVNRRHIRTVCRATRSDTVVFLTTFIGTVLLNLDTAIYLGIAVSLALFLQKAASPSLVEYGFNDEGHLAALPASETRPNPQISIIHVEGDLFFGAADLFQDEVRTLAAQQDIRVFILRMKNARHLDGSTVLALDQLIALLHSQGRHLLISGVHGDVARVLRRSGLIHRLGAENVFPAEENPTLATKRALQRATALLGGVKADVRIFYDKEKQPA